MLDRLFKPRAVAVIGASNNPLSIGHIVLSNLIAYGYRGAIFPINPKAPEIKGLKAYPSVLAVPDEIDLVNVSVAVQFIPQVITECGEKGIKFAIVHTAGFKEIGPEGRQREIEMVELAHKYGMRIFGPNSQGIQNSDPEVSVYANFTFVPMKPGRISIVAQSGGCGEMLKLHLHKVGIGHRIYCSYGNESDLTMPEILEYYGQDEGTRAIMIQIESFKHPDRFLAVAQRITPHKPILALKAGRTREGSVAVSSHTGSLVDQGTMATAMFRKAGVVEFSDTDEMIKTAIAFETSSPPKGRRIALVTNTGGPGVQAVDEAILGGLELATWSPEGLARLQATQLPMASLRNPVDVVATAGPDQYYAAVDTLLREEGVDMVLVFFVTPPFVDLEAIAARIKEVTAGSDKPVVMVVETSEKWYSLIDNLRRGGLPVYEFPEDGARVLANMARYARLRDRKTEPRPEVAADRERVGDILSRQEGQDRYLSQLEAFEILSAYGIPVPRIAPLVTGGDQEKTAPALERAAQAVGFPCALKVDDPAVVHKSEAGGVALALRNIEELRQAHRVMQGRFSDRKTAYLVMEHKDPGRELIIGTKRSPGLGSLVMFGLGGIFVEVMKDVAFSVAPLTRVEACELVTQIKGYPVLQGLRGEAGVDLEALAELLVRVSALAADFPAIAALDLNPIFAYRPGLPPAVVDVRMKIQSRGMVC